jgi:hypothetical protein
MFVDLFISPLHYKLLEAGSAAFRSHEKNIYNLFLNIENSCDLDYMGFLLMNFW